MSYEPPPAPDQQPYGGAPVGPRPGELLDRFLARFIDGIILAVAYGVLAVGIIGGVLLSSAGWFVYSLITTVILVALQMGYFVYMESTRGQTVGKMLMKLRVLGPDGGNPTMEQSFRRNIWMAAGLLGVLGVLGSTLSGLAQLVAVIMIAVGINKDTVNRQAWHDHFGGETRVVKEG
jgi:uncharacterized RDD family membrane protein YckC